MIALFRLHTYYLFNQKTQRMMIILCGLTAVVLGVLSGVFTERYLYIDYTTYFFEYRLESLTFLQFCAFALSFYVTMQLFYFKPYDTLLVQLKPKTIILLSKALVAWLVVNVYWFYAVLTMVTFGLISGFAFTLKDITSLLANGVVLNGHYLLLYLLCAHFIKHILGLFVPLFGWFAKGIIFDMHTTVTQNTFLHQLIHTLFLSFSVPLQGQVRLTLSPMGFLIFVLVSLLLVTASKKKTL